MKKLFTLLLALCLLSGIALAGTATGTVLLDPSQSVSVTLPEGYLALTPDVIDEILSPENIQDALDQGLSSEVIDMIDTASMTGALTPDQEGMMYFICMPASGATNRTFAMNKAGMDLSVNEIYPAMGYNVLATDMFTVEGRYWYSCTVEFNGEVSTLYITLVDGYEVDVTFVNVPEADILSILATVEVL